jgi:hypothetical protein
MLFSHSNGLPGYLQQLDLVCTNRHAHPLPVRMEFIGTGTSDKGQPYAVYACTFPGCRWREGYVAERRTGQPFQLWAGFHRSNGSQRRRVGVRYW